MTDNEKNYIRSQLPDYISRVTRYVKSGKYICPLCHSGEKKNGTPGLNIVPNSNDMKFKCHACGAGGDIFDLYAAINGIDLKTALAEVPKLYSYSSIQPADNRKQFQAAVQTAAKPQQVDYTNFFIDAHKHIAECDYLLKRGISAEIQHRFNIGYVPDWKHPKAPNSPASPRIIIPTSEYSYLARDTRQHIPDSQKQYSKSKVGKMHIFNVADLEKEYCFIVEGEIDALSVIQSGFNCVALGSVNMIRNLLQYCKTVKPSGVLIFALDNDKAGQAAAAKIPEFQQVGIKCTAANISGAAKDPNELLVSDAEQLKRNLQQAVEQARQVDFSFQAPADEPESLPNYFYFDKKDELRVSPPLLAKYIRENNKYIFVRNQATDGVNRFWYKKGCYCHISDNELKGLIKSHIVRYDETALKMKDVYEVYNNITTDLNFISGNQINADENVINFQNGLLYLDSMKLSPHTPDALSTIQIPCNFTINAADTPVFDKFLDDFTGGNNEKKRFLLQYMALCISNIKGYRIKKALFMVGSGNSGKSQLKALTEMLIGSENCSSVTLSELEARFGTSNLYNKRLVGDSDMSFMSVKELKMFKQVTGGDSIQVEFKNRTPFNYTYPGLMWFCMNELPRFSGDRGQWVYDRIIIFKADNVIPEEKRDKHLLDKMYSEREAIISKYLIPILANLLKNDLNIDIPSECKAFNKQYQQDNSPVLTFFNECCTMREQENGKKIKDSCTTKKMYEVFKAWCKDNNGGYCPSVREFNNELITMFKFSEVKQLYNIIHGTRYYIFTITHETKDFFNSIYGVDTIS